MNITKKLLKLRIVSSLTLVMLLFQNCEKENYYKSKNLSEIEVINQARYLIGGDEKLFIINSKDSGLSSNKLSDNIKINFRPLSLNEFVLFHKIINKKTTLSSEAIKIKGIRNNQLDSIKSNGIQVHDELDYDDPRKAGYYHARFPYYTWYYTNINNDVGLAGKYEMYLDFNTDENGRVIGSPTVSFTGLGLFSFNQINSSDITFNSSNGNSYFTITGSTVFGFQFGGATIGWTSRSNYMFTVNMDEANTKNAVHVEQN